VLKRVIVLCALVYKSTYAKYTASVRRLSRGNSRFLKYCEKAARPRPGTPTGEQYRTGVGSDRRLTFVRSAFIVRELDMFVRDQVDMSNAHFMTTTTTATSMTTIEVLARRRVSDR